MQILGAVAAAIDRLNRMLGHGVAWFALVLVLAQFLVVVLRYVFGLGYAWLQESLLYQHSILFMLGAGYTLLADGHVRIDIFYRDATPRQKAIVNLVGVAVFLWPVCGLLWWTGWPYVSRSWRILEGSKETSGLHAVFLLKSLILAMTLALALQGAAIAIRAARCLLDPETVAPSEKPSGG